MILATTPTTNEKQGSGKYRPLRRRKQQKSEKKAEEFSYLSNTDLRMRFNTSKDPIYFVFECLENRSVVQLMGDFVKDSFFEITNFVSKAVK
ncbi:MAG: hypothetical protein WCY19_08985 [Candidatus Gastranaerophilaceae bacterium]